MKNTILFTVVMLFCNMAFAQMQYIPTNGKSARLRHASPKEENAIRVYTEKSEVPANAEKIGVLVGNYRKKGKAFIAAKSFAAQAKGDAILYVDGTDSHTGNIHDKGTYNFNVYRLKPDWKNTETAAQTGAETSIITDLSNETGLVETETETEQKVTGYTVGEKVEYLVSLRKKLPATVLEKISDHEYLLMIHYGDKDVKKKTPTYKIGRIKQQ